MNEQADNVLFSIITPSYNQGQFIEATINSVLNQTFRNFEYIIVDGDSSDNTKEILNKYKNNNNIKIIIEKDNGQSDAINKGFKIARGVLVGWINSDDLLKKDCLDKILNQFQNNSNAAIYYGDLDVINESGERIGEIRANKITYNYLLNHNPDITQQGSFYNGRYLREIGYLDENLHYTMDYDLWLRLLKKGDAIKINEKIAEFRFQKSSKTIGKGNALKFWRDIFFVRRTKHVPSKISMLSLYFIKWCIIAGLRKLKIIRSLI